MKEYDGVILIDKEKGITSFDVVRKVKKLLNIQKVGHTGTLDPLATGLLPICVGRGTKAVNYLINDNKEYIAEIKLGENTDTYDREGTTIETFNCEVSKSQFQETIDKFCGEIYQMPPKYSALKINGKRMYELARSGYEFEIPERKITIYEIELLEFKFPYATISVKCSKGTYIRSLAYDIGKSLGCGGHIYNLRRISSGQFNIDKAIDINSCSLEDFEENIIPIEKLFMNIECIFLNPYFEKLFKNGVGIMDYRLISKIKENGIYRIYNEQETFMGLGIKKDNYFKMESLF